MYLGEKRQINIVCLRLNPDFDLEEELVYKIGSKVTELILDKCRILDRKSFKYKT